MDDQFHIIVAGDKRQSRSFLLTKRKLQLSGVIILSLFVAISILGSNVFHSFFPDTSITSQVTQLNDQLQKSKSEKKELARQVQELQNLNRKQTETFQQEKTTLLNTAVTELEERSTIIERIICNLGVEVKDVPKNNANSGGPFLIPPKDNNRDLLFRSDKYLDAIASLPLGRPVPGLITSRFGHRTDPVNGRKGFHTGVDMRAKRGQEIKATGDGVVTKAFVNGSYGRFVEIRHGNGYSTKFAHMTKILVKRGDRVKRGQPIGTVGSSGRSTGPHLHYEVCFANKPINPSKFMRVDKLIQPPLMIKPRKKIKYQLAAAAAKAQNLSSAIQEN